MQRGFHHGLLGAAGQDVAPETAASIDALLRGVSPDLRLRR